MLLREKKEDTQLKCSDAIARKIGLWLYKRQIILPEKLNEVRKKFRRILVQAGFPLPYEILISKVEGEEKMLCSVSNNRFFLIDLTSNNPVCGLRIVEEEEIRLYFYDVDSETLSLFRREVSGIFFEQFGDHSYRARVAGKGKRIEIFFQYIGSYRGNSIANAENNVAAFLKSEEAFSLTIVDFYKKMHDLLKEMSLSSPIRKLDITFYKGENITDFV